MSSTDNNEEPQLVDDRVTAGDAAAASAGVLANDDPAVESGEKNTKAKMEEASPGIRTTESKNPPLGQDEALSLRPSDEETVPVEGTQNGETSNQVDGDEDPGETTEFLQGTETEKNQDEDGEEEAETNALKTNKNDDNDQEEHGDDDDDDSDSASGIDKKHKAQARSSMPPRPVKRARTAYFIFTDEKRPKVQGENPGEGVAVVSRIMGQMWSKLSAEEKQSYQEKAALERDRVAKELEEWKSAGGVLKTDKGGDAPNKDSSTLIYPPARIRKICKLDPEVRGMSKEALLMITKMAELATIKLGQETARVAQLQNRRKLLPEDVAHVCSHRDQFLFLKDDVKDLLKDQVSKQEPKTTKKGDATREAAAVGSKSITSFFGVAKK